LISASLIASAFGSRVRADSESRAWSAAAVPRLTIGAGLTRLEAPVLGQRMLIEAFARLQWPLESLRHPRAGSNRVIAQMRASERLAELKRQRAALREKESSFERQLDLEELEAEERAVAEEPSP
jgi:hypothetical protein